MGHFNLDEYKQPDFTELKFLKAPNTTFVECEKDSIAPERYHATTIFPEYFKVDNQWLLAEDSRMDCSAVLRDNKTIDVVEFRNLKKGDKVAIGRLEDAEEGIFVHTDCFAEEKKHAEVFAFRGGRSRETAYSIDYDFLYELLKYEKDNGYITWVLGPACTFDSDSRNAFSLLIKNGYVNAVLGGNAVATHDLEAGYFKTALGQDIYTQNSRPNGHYNHLDIINRVKDCGSIKKFIKHYNITDGIMLELERKKIPYVLTGSIRDDGPLPEVFENVYEGQDSMRNIIKKTTTLVCMATALHSIATGNMTPSYRVINGKIRPLYIYSIDISEFSVNKIKDRGSLTVRTLVTNVQDFIVNLLYGLNIKRK